MGLQIRTYVGGEQKFIELYGNENITMNVSFAEVQDIRKKNSAYSQEFKVPGSKNNNEIFNYFFDINAVALDFNPKLKFEADLIYDGYEIFNGFIRLNSVTIDKIEKIYSLTFYSQVGDLAANIGDKALCNVDTTSLNHSLYRQAVVNSIFFDPSLQPPDYIRQANPTYAQFLDTFDAGWDGPVGQGQVQYYLTYRGYDYTGSTTGSIIDIDYLETPILSFSGVNRFFDYYDSPLRLTYMMPSLRVNTLYELICNQAGYQLQSEFFETDYFKRYYLPLSFNTEQPNMAQAANLDYYFVNLSGQSLGSTGLTYNEFGSGILESRRIVEAKEIVKNQPALNPVDPTYLGGIGRYLFRLPYGDVDYRYRFVTEYTGSTVGPGNQVLVSDVKFAIFNGFDPITGTIFGTLIDTDLIRAYEDDNGGNSTIATNSDVGSLSSNINQLYFLAYTPINPNFDVNLNEVTFSATTDSLRLPQVIELNKEMSCEQKQIEFISDINRMFNLIVVEHPIKPNTIIVEPAVNYIGKGEQLDWTDKVDYDLPQTLFPTTTLINGSIFASNKKDNDFINTEFFKRSNLTFGQQFFDLGIEYKNEQINLTQNLGQNTDYYLNASGNTNFAIPCLFVTKENNVDGVTNFEFRPFRSLPRITFASVPLPSGNTGQPAIFIKAETTSPQFNLLPVPVGTIWNLNRMTTYPFVIEGFSHYTTYNQTDIFTPDEPVYPQLENQYDRYYYDYVEDLISEENKILQCKMYLTPWDVSQLYFNETIFIKNAKFRINKISNLSLIEPGKCDVELVKLTRDYVPTPTLFYDLISCDDECDIIHTHTDLVYPIFAFEGNFVNLTITWSNSGVPTVKRYKVVRSTWNPDYEYQKIFLTPNRELTNFGGTFTTYALSAFQTYSACTGNTLTYTLNVINEFAEGYDLSDCFLFDITNTGLTGTSIIYLDCSGNTQSVSISAGQIYQVCAINGSIQGTDIEICFASLVPCTPPVPTPNVTPQPTPAISSTPDVTPTPTPSAGRCRQSTQIRVTVEGYIQYVLCDGATPVLVYVRPGFVTIPDCIEYASLTPSSVTPSAVFTIVNPGPNC